MEKRRNYELVFQSKEIKYVEQLKITDGSQKIIINASTLS